MSNDKQAEWVLTCHNKWCHAGFKRVVADKPSEVVRCTGCGWPTVSAKRAVEVAGQTTEGT